MLPRMPWAEGMVDADVRPMTPFRTSIVSASREKPVPSARTAKTNRLVSNIPLRPNISATLPKKSRNEPQVKLFHLVLWKPGGNSQKDSRRGSCHPSQLWSGHVKVPFDERGYDKSASLKKAWHSYAHRRREDEQNLLRSRAEDCWTSTGPRRLIFKGNSGIVFRMILPFGIFRCWHYCW